MNVMLVLGNIAIIAGTLIFATAALGIVRFPDPYTRISAVGTAGGLGIILVVVGALLLDPGAPAALKVLLIIVLQLATSSVGSIAIARSAYLTGARVRNPQYNDLDGGK